MSSIDVYHYGHRGETVRREPRKIEIDNGSAFVNYIHKILGIDLGKPGEGEKSQRVYNELIASDAPEWKKIVSTFASSGTLVYDEDREKVANALRVAETHLNVPFSQLTGLALVLEALPKGLVAVNYSIMGNCLGFETDSEQWQWYSKKELGERFLRATKPTEWTYRD